jgi:hypothetical protein
LKAQQFVYIFSAARKKVNILVIIYFSPAYFFRDTKWGARPKNLSGVRNPVTLSGYFILLSTN